MPYDLKTIRAPRLVGASLRMAVGAIESSIGRAAIAPKLMRDAGIEGFRKVQLDDPPSVAPTLPRASSLPDQSGAPSTSSLESVLTGSPEPKGFRFERVADFARAYRENKTTPEAVAEQWLAAYGKSEASTPPLRAIIASEKDQVLAQARASTERFKQGKPLGPFDGVPVAIKDEVDALPYVTTAGTAFVKIKPERDGFVVKKLREAGAVIVGKANMHEIGIDTSGFNPHHGTPRNPYNPNHYTGGSSSGSGAAVASGLCPVAIGADGGGSIRIPASLCGVVGLKATFSRISEAGAFPLCWSVAHVGPLGATVRDVALAYAAIAGVDPNDPNTATQPPVRTDGLGESVKGMKLGIYRPWFDDSQKAVAQGCDEAVQRLVAQGAELVEVELPDLELCRLAHGITILTEMLTAMERYDDAHRSDYGLGVRMNLALARELNNRDYVKAQQVRTRMIRHMEAIFAKCDVLVTPSTAITAPAIRPDVLPSGESDLDMTSGMMRYVFLTNLTGHPGLSVPVGYDGNGMPIGLQLTGRFWEEHTLLRVGEQVERQVERKAPQVHFRLLPNA
jgi:Asp-tRNA(Asn)/Glu-tRNA(Gln) amidotransferase A subunit family amidase